MEDQPRAHVHTYNQVYATLRTYEWTINQPFTITNWNAASLMYTITVSLTAAVVKLNKNIQTLRSLNTNPTVR